MISFIPPRWRKPLGYILAGLALAGAFLARGGPVWPASIPLVIGAAARAFVVYRRAGQDTDDGALAGSRADERLKLITWQARSVALNVTMIAAFAGLVAGIAVRQVPWWPFAAILAVGALSYVFGLQNYGAYDDSPAEDAGAQQAHYPVGC